MAHPGLRAGRFEHALVSFTDRFTLKAWADLEVPGLPDLGEQVRLFGKQVLPQLP